MNIVVFEYPVPGIPSSDAVGAQVVEPVGKFSEEGVEKVVSVVEDEAIFEHVQEKGTSPEDFFFGLDNRGERRVNTLLGKLSEVFGKSLLDDFKFADPEESARRKIPSHKQNVDIRIKSGHSPTDRAEDHKRNESFSIVAFDFGKHSLEKSIQLFP